MSQAGRPRPRYIAICITAERPVSRKALQNALTGQSRRAGLDAHLVPKVTRFEHPHAIVWSDHRAVADVRRVLKDMSWVIEGDTKLPVRIETLSTSGTILGLTDRTRLLQARGNDRARAPRTSGGKAPRRS